MHQVIIIAHLPDYPDGGSTARRVEAFARGLVSQQAEVSLVIPLKQRQGELEKTVAGVHVLWLSTLKWAPRFIAIFFSRIKLLIWTMRNLQRHSPGWLFLYNLNLEGIALIWIAHLTGWDVATIVCDIRDFQATGLRLWAQKAADYALTKMSDLNIVISDFLRKRAINWANNVPCIVIPPMVDTERFRFDSEQGVKFRIKHDLVNKPLVGYFGSLYFNQGLPSLLQAIKHLKDIGMILDIVIAGTSSRQIQCSDIGSISKELGIQDQVHEVGWLPESETIAAMSACDVLAIPRIVHPVNEAGSPTKLAEYLSMGRAVIAAGVGDISAYHMIKPGFILTKPGDSDSIAEALFYLFSTPENRHRLEIISRHLAEDFFDYRIALTSLVEILDSVSAAGQNRH